MKRNMSVSAVALVALMGATAVAGDIESGLQVGQSAGAFNVTDCTGPAQGSTLCYR